ncbi:MAG: NADH dehydrogenase [Planctomycetota bacterium]|jgi:NADH dehydrogenase
MTTEEKHQKGKHTVIVGAGFFGVRTALDLAKKDKNHRITIIDKHPFMTYYPALYRVATGSSPVIARIPLSDIFSRYPQITLVQDTVASIDLDGKKVVGTHASYPYDYLVLGLGSVPRQFDIEGTKEISYSFLTMTESLKLRKHVDEMFSCASTQEPEKNLMGLHFIVVGGGASGVELAGELAAYVCHCADGYCIDRSLITIDLFDSKPRILGRLPESVSRAVTLRLRKLGVYVHCNRRLKGGTEDSGVLFEDMSMKSQTIIWTAGTQVHPLYETVPDFTLTEHRRIQVDALLRPSGEKYPEVFIGGDAADTKNAGLAQTAITDGGFVAKTIHCLIHQKKLPVYRAGSVAHSIPVGPGWGVFSWHGVTWSGWSAWVLRYLIDLHFYFSILSYTKVMTLLRKARNAQNMPHK